MWTDNTAMGVQSGSENPLSQYNRRTSCRQILNAASILKDLNARVQIDLICKSFENDDNRRDTLISCSQCRRSRSQNRAALVLLPKPVDVLPNSRISDDERQSIPTSILTLRPSGVLKFSLTDDLPQSAVMYLSYLNHDYRLSAEDFKPETGARWIRTRLRVVPSRYSNFSRSLTAERKQCSRVWTPYA
jgi:hypothetical protein